MAIDPFFTGALSSVVGGVFGNKNVEKQIAANRAEAERARQWNLHLAKLQNQWNVQQWERENAYNTPAAQRGRFEVAGLNPDLMVGGTQSLSASSPGMTSGQGTSPTDMSPMERLWNAGDIIRAGLDRQLQQAQIDNINADTQKKKADATGQEIENQFKPGLMSGQIALNNVQVDLGKSGIKLNDAQADKLNKEVEAIDQSMQESKARIQEIQANIGNINWQQAFQDKQLQFEIDKFAKEYGLRVREVESAIQLAATQGNLNAVTALLRQSENENVKALGNNISLEGDMLEFDLQYQKDNRKFLNAMSSISAVTGAIGSLLGGTAQIVSRMPASRVGKIGFK